MQKTAAKNTKYSRNETILKIGHHAKVIAMQNPDFRSKIKIEKQCENPFYKSFEVVLCKETALKNIKYSRNGTILKIGYQGKAIADAKS